MSDIPKTATERIRKKQGSMIRQFRTLHKLSQSDLAEKLSVTKAAVSDWERGVSTPRQALQVQIARELQAPWTVLFGLDAEAVA